LDNCPPGWHLPTDDDWKILESYLGMEPSEINNFGRRGRFSGKLLSNGGGSGFDAVHGGYQNSCVNGYGHQIFEGHYWTSSLTDDRKPIIRVFPAGTGEISRVATICHGASSIRYIQDAKAD
jgi:uncharacterized protein (TIGR02145 family)